MYVLDELELKLLKSWFQYLIVKLIKYKSRQQNKITIIIIKTNDR